MLKDIDITHITADFNIDFAKGQRQRAINWLSLDTQQVYTTYGVDWRGFLANDNINISLQAIIDYATQVLAKNNMNFEVININTDDPSAPVLTIKEVENGLGQ